MANGSASPMIVARGLASRSRWRRIIGSWSLPRRRRRWDHRYREAKPGLSALTGKVAILPMSECSLPNCAAESRTQRRLDATPLGSIGAFFFLRSWKRRRFHAFRWSKHTPTLYPISSKWQYVTLPRRQHFEARPAGRTGAGWVPGARARPNRSDRTLRKLTLCDHVTVFGHHGGGQKPNEADCGPPSSALEAPSGMRHGSGLRAASYLGLRGHSMCQGLRYESA